MSHVDPNATTDDSVRWQGLRNRIYAIAVAVAALLVALNVIDQATSAQWLNIATLALNIGGLVYGLVVAELARRNSDPGKVAVLPTPAADVEAVFTTNGDTVAGPASTLKTGTVLEGDGDEAV